VAEAAFFLDDRKTLLEEGNWILKSFLGARHHARLLGWVGVVPIEGVIIFTLMITAYSLFIHRLIP
jgi:hypothetical protein